MAPWHSAYTSSGSLKSFSSESSFTRAFDSSGVDPVSPAACNTGDDPNNVINQLSRDASFLTTQPAYSNTYGSQLTDPADNQQPAEGSYVTTAHSNAHQSQSTQASYVTTEPAYSDRHHSPIREAADDSM